MQKIIQIGVDNDYNIRDLQSIYNKIHKSNIMKLVYPNIKPRNRFVSLQYNKHLTKPIKNALQKHNITTAVRNTNKLGNLLLNCKHKLPTPERNGVYKIKCGGCEKFYIGQTCRKLTKRFGEHIKDARNSALGRHLAETGHTTSYDNIHLLHNVGKSFKMTLLEEMEITKQKARNPQNILNNIVDFSKNRLFLKFLKLPTNNQIDHLPP